jgi:hypothetical protein
VDPIPIESYAELVEGPANRGGIVLERNLVQRLLQDAGQPDSLPLLAFILRRLYDLHFEGSYADRCASLAIQDYDKCGGLAGAVQNAADRILKEPIPAADEIRALRDAFIPGLVRTNDEGSYSRRRAFLNKLPLKLKAERLLERFVHARLLVAGKDGKATVEIAHEALLRTWPKLANWLVEDRDKLRQHNAIVRAAREWDESGRKLDLLVHRDGRLEDAKKLVSERRLKDAERLVRAESVRAEDARKLAEAQKQRAELSEQREKDQKEAARKLRLRAVERVLIQKQRISKIRGRAWRTNSTLGSASSIQAMTDTSLVGRGLAIFGRSFGIQLYGHLELLAPTQNIEPTSGTPRGTTR